MKPPRNDLPRRLLSAATAAEMAGRSLVDVLHPPIVTIGGRRYRVNIPLVSSSSGRRKPDRDDGAPTAPAAGWEEDEEAAEMASDVTPLDDGRFRLVLDVPPAFQGRLVGPGGSKRQQLEADTGANVCVPRPATGKSGVVIEAASLRSLESCRTRIELITASA